MSCSPLVQATDGVGKPSAEHVITIDEPERTVNTLPAVACTGTISDKDTIVTCEEMINGG